MRRIFAGGRTGLRLAAAMLAVALPMVFGPAQAQTTASTGVPAAAASPDNAPPEVRQLMQLIQSPAVQGWLNAAQAQPRAPGPETTGQMPVLSSLIDHVRHHVTMVADAAADLPQQTETAADIVGADLDGAGGGRVSLKLLVLLFAGPLAELVFRAVSKRRRIPEDRHGHPRGPIATLVGRMVPPLVFATATLVPLLAFAFPPVSQTLAIALAIALVSTRFALAAGRLVVTLITLPLTDGHSEVALGPALYWFRRVTVFAIYFAAGWAFLQVLPPLGFSVSSRLFMAYLLGIGLLMIAVEAIWSRPSGENRRSVAVSWLLSLYCLLLWSFWVAGINWLLWLGIYALILPRFLSIATKAVRALHRAEEGFLASRPIAAVLLDRGVRAVIITLAAVWMGYILGLGAETMMAPETPASRLSRGVISGIVVLLAADLVWHLIKTAITVKLTEAPLSSDLSDEENARRARMQTLLPIFRNMSAVIVSILAGMMVLSGVGIEIGPLIAGAGIVGVAVGFGAQTLVKDVISGVFYLWDDAFRIGEYIESGSHKGVVEAFSLRSVKLRHHRGPLTTVPFGSLGAVRNLNRDWTIDKISLRVPYATDLVLMKKVIKQIGQQLLENPEFGPNIIETLKMKGVEEFGDFAIVVRLSMTTKPGTQFVIRRSALAMIRNAFRENGIEFAVPTVQVSGGEAREADALAVASRYHAEVAARAETAA